MSKNIALVIFDSYGVFLKGGYPTTCDVLAKKCRIPAEKIYEVLYKKYFNQAAVRKITQFEAWKLALRELGIALPVSHVKALHYSFMRVNKEVVQLVKQMQKKYTVVLVTKNTRSQWADVRKNIPEIEQAFGKHIINTWEYNLPKASKKTLDFICKRYKVKPKEILYIDDQKENLEVPKQLGVTTILYVSFNELRKRILAI